MFLNIQSALKLFSCLKTCDIQNWGWYDPGLLFIGTKWCLDGPGRVWAGWFEANWQELFCYHLGEIGCQRPPCPPQIFAWVFGWGGWAWDSVLGIEWFLLFLPLHIKTIRRTDLGLRKNNSFFQEWKKSILYAVVYASFVQEWVLYHNMFWILTSKGFVRSQSPCEPILSFQNNLCHFKLICVWSVSEL